MQRSSTTFDQYTSMCTAAYSAQTIDFARAEYENHVFLSSAASWSAYDGSVGSGGPVGTFVGSANRLQRRSAPRGPPKRDF